MEKILELVIDEKFVLNDNQKNTPKINMGKYKRLEAYAHDGIAFSDVDCKVDVNRRCWVKPIEACNFSTPAKTIKLILRHYKFTNRKFDLLNYERTFKPLIDALTNAGYFVDDNYEVLVEVSFQGGNHHSYKRDYDKDLKMYLEDCGFDNPGKNNVLEIYVV